jgi:hypothetical protein
MPDDASGRHECPRPARCQTGTPEKGHELLALSVVLNEVNIVLAFLPTAVMAPTQTAMMRASITPYSTDVGPSSLLRKLATRWMDGYMNLLLLRE